MVDFRKKGSGIYSNAKTGRSLTLLLPLDGKTQETDRAPLHIKNFVLAPTHSCKVLRPHVYFEMDHSIPIKSNSISEQLLEFGEIDAALFKHSWSAASRLVMLDSQG